MTEGAQPAVAQEGEGVDHIREMNVNNNILLNELFRAIATPEEQVVPPANNDTSRRDDTSRREHLHIMGTFKRRTKNIKKN